MAGVIWGATGHAGDAGIQEFLAGDDVLLDRELFAFDIVATKAHARGLGVERSRVGEKSKTRFAGRNGTYP